MVIAAVDNPARLQEDEAILEAARENLRVQARALEQQALQLGDGFCAALRVLRRCAGRVIVSGIGKSGIVARKLAATLSCTGTPASFLHPGDAAHGDLGVVTPKDVVILVSHGGESGEVTWLLPQLRERGVALIAITGNPLSTIGRAADVVLAIADQPELEHGTVPTTSAVLAQALCDALAMAAMRQRNTSAAEVLRNHPGSPPRQLGEDASSRVPRRARG